MDKNLILKNDEGLKFYISKNLNNISFIKHFFSTKIGGVSEGVYNSLNLGIYTDDNKENISVNFNKILFSAGMQNNKVVYLKQVHGDRFYIVDDNNYNNIIGLDGDALITKSKDIAIGVFTADCVPIILVDRYQKIIAVVHAGWKGTQLKIVSKVLNHIIKEMGAKPENIFAAIGPSIGQCCFEVKKDVAEMFNYKIQTQGKFYVDLWKENIKQVIDIGIPETNIECENLCTMCGSELFFSYRRDNGDTGRQGTFIQII